MTRKKKTTVTKIAAAAAAAAVRANEDERTRLSLAWSADDDEDDDEEVADSVLDDLEQIDEAAGGDITWELYCDTPLEKAGQIRKLARSELRNLRDECLSLGPGDYHVVARGAKGKFVPKSRRNIKISGFARGPVAAASAGPSFDPTAFLVQVEERAERRRAEERAQRQQLLRFWAPFAAPIAVEMAKGLFGRSSGDSIKDLVGALVGMKDLVGGGGSQVDTLLKGIELARDMQPDGGKGSTWPDVLANGVTSLAKEFRPVIETLAQRRGQSAGAAAAQSNKPQLQFGPAKQPSTTGPPAAPKAEAPPASGDNDMFVMFEPLLRRLAADLEDFATNAADAGLVAEALLAKVPRMIKSQVPEEQLKEWLNRPDWWQVLVEFHPALQPYQAYCDDVRLDLIGLCNPPADDVDDKAETDTETH